MLGCTEEGVRRREGEEGGQQRHLSYLRTSETGLS